MDFMTDNLTEKDKATAAAIARAIVAAVDESGPFVNVHYNYPKGSKAFEYGFGLMMGAMTAFSIAMLAVSAVKWVLS